MNTFNSTKYTRWYWAIVSKRAITDRNVKGEVHHIIPRSLGGSDDPENLVKLSGHDHAWCHWLLTKMTSGRDYELMTYAFNMMGVAGEHMDRPKSYAIVRAYERNREEWSRIHSERMSGRETWNKGRKLEGEKYKAGGKKNRGRILSEEQAEAKRLRQIGQKRSEETKRKQSEAAKKYLAENPRPEVSDETRQKLRDLHLGKSKGHGAKVAAANRGVVSINKDGVEKKIRKEDLDSWISQGWAKGGKTRDAQKGKKRGPYKMKPK